MKFIKTYEMHTSTIINVWKVPYKLPHTEIAAQKLGADLTTYHLYKLNGEKKFNSIFIYFIEEIDGDIVTWFFNQGINYGMLGNYNYKGEIEITNEDIEDYYIKKNTDKYNL